MDFRSRGDRLWVRWGWGWVIQQAELRCSGCGKRGRVGDNECIRHWIPVFVVSKRANIREWFQVYRAVSVRAAHGVIVDVHGVEVTGEIDLFYYREGGGERGKCSVLLCSIVLFGLAVDIFFGATEGLLRNVPLRVLASPAIAWAS